MFPQPVPPTFTASVDEADQVPERIVATPVSAEESIPVPPLTLESVPEMFDSVEVAVHVGTPLTRARVKPSVVFEMEDKAEAEVV